MEAAASDLTGLRFPRKSPRKRTGSDGYHPLSHQQPYLLTIHRQRKWLCPVLPFCQVSPESPRYHFPFSLIATPRSWPVYPLSRQINEPGLPWYHWSPDNRLSLNKKQCPERYGARSHLFFCPILTIWRKNGPPMGPERSAPVVNQNKNLLHP